MPGGTGKRFKKIAEKEYDGKLADLARALGMKPGSFSKYTSGETMPGGRILKRLLQMGINLNWFLIGEEPMYTKHLKQAQVSRVTVQDSNLADEMAEEFADQENQEKKDKEAAERVEHFFRDVNTENLNSREANLLAEVKQFSYFLETRPLNPQVKRLLLQLLIESIDQAIEQPQHGPAPSVDD